MLLVEIRRVAASKHRPHKDVCQLREGEFFADNEFQNHFFFLKYTSVATVVSAIKPTEYMVP